MDTRMSVWQDEEQRCAAVLREVFSWLEAPALARAGAACRAWRRAAAEPALWRRLLRARLPRRTRPAPHTPHTPHAEVSWRQEYVLASAGWRLAARHRAGSTLLHASLAPGGARLALAAADASLALWRCEAGQWREQARAELGARGWSAVARAHWAASGARLLLAGPLALVDDWELLVLHVEDDDGRVGAVASRVRCSAGAAGCWADAAGDAFVSLSLRRLGRDLYCTTVWLNAATQETQSEFTGVTAPVLRIFNEAGVHFTHALVADTPSDDTPLDGDDGEEPASDDDGETGPGLAYLRAVAPGGASEAQRGGARLLLAGGGGALGAWRLRAPRPPPLLAREAGGLAERLQRHRERRAVPEQDAPEPDEASVRASCTPPIYSYRLPAPLVGLILHESGRCLWAVCSDGSATCLSVVLRVLCRVRAPGGDALAGTHYVHPAVSDAYLACPGGAYSARVWCWSSRTGARGAAPLRHGAAAVCCVLPPTRPRSLLVLTGDELYVCNSGAHIRIDDSNIDYIVRLTIEAHEIVFKKASTDGANTDGPLAAPHTHIIMALLAPLQRVARACLSATRPRTALASGGGACGGRTVPPCAPCVPAPQPACLSVTRPRTALASGGGACGGRTVPPCAPCVPAPQPACRARPPAVRRAQRVVCCAPPQGSRPPCKPRDPACSLTCRDYLDQNRELSTRVPDDIPSRNVINGGSEQDPVARRLKHAKRTQQAEYEREVARRAASQRVERSPPPAPYQLGGERECARATDGCTYAVPRQPAAARACCGRDGTPPPPRCVELAPDDGCRIKGDGHLDPCAHRPRVMIEIDRSANTTLNKVPPAVKPTATGAEGCAAKRAGHASWCANPPRVAAAPQRCRRPTIIERLRARSGPRLPDSRGERRLHTSAVISKAVKSKQQSKTSSSVSDGLEGMIRSKKKLKEAGRGRIVVDVGGSRTASVKPSGGRLELFVPPGTERVAVQVTLGGAERSPAGPSSACTTVSSASSECAPKRTCKSSLSCNNFAATSEKRDPWISIKNIQRKWTGCRFDETSTAPVSGLPLSNATFPNKLWATRSTAPRAVETSASSPCSNATDKSIRCRPPTPSSCKGSPHSKRDTKRCSSTSAFLANKIVVNS